MKLPFELAACCNYKQDSMSPATKQGEPADAVEAGAVLEFKHKASDIAREIHLNNTCDWLSVAYGFLLAKDILHTRAWELAVWIRNHTTLG